MDSFKMLLVRAFIAAGGLATLTTAHMELANPPPFPKARTDNSPVQASNFPCQFSPDLAQYDRSNTTPMPKGKTQKMSFRGGASHGGGSCQISITYDDPPTKDSVWKVIHSIQGGCPARKGDDHIGGDRDMLGPDTYDFQIPDIVPEGNATLAWSWINRIGGVPEFYMNCAPISIVGGGGDEAALNSLPDMFIANLPGITDCVIPFGTDLKYPNPGSSVETWEQAKLLEPTCSFYVGGSAAAPASKPAGENAPASASGTMSATAAPSGTAAPPASDDAAYMSAVDPSKSSGTGDAACAGGVAQPAGSSVPYIRGRRPAF
ncbi:hypothetical protein VTJ83DRAFT_5826 [Remersonia thermophila]|uniref:Lytic polysaccharide monooxygenase n=1 Tax=Remersonia thermophila TaxID=72144 RepID=A0ABR4DA64_9PEZI